MQCIRQYFKPSLYILFAADFNYLIRWVIVTSTLLSIRVVNSHATSAYEYELFAFKYLAYDVKCWIGDSTVSPAATHCLRGGYCLILAHGLSRFLRVLNLSMRLF